jgi:hypothetical protein
VWIPYGFGTVLAQWADLAVAEDNCERDPNVLGMRNMIGPAGQHQRGSSERHRGNNVPRNLLISIGV